MVTRVIFTRFLRAKKQEFKLNTNVDANTLAMLKACFTRFNQPMENVAAIFVTKYTGPGDETGNARVYVGVDKDGRVVNTPSVSNAITRKNYLAAKQL